MYKSFEDAKKAALDVVERIYNGDKMDCVVVERRGMGCNRFSFRFYSSDTEGKFVPTRDRDGEERRTRI